MSAVGEYKRVCAIVRGKEYWAVDRSDVADAADKVVAELDAALAERDGMLRLAWDLHVGVASVDDLDAEYAKWLSHMHDVVADLRARVAAPGPGMVPARGPLFGDGVWERRQDNPPGLGLINDVVPPDRVED